jgi:RNA polymerase sigma-70 factor, ECF subfamily
MQMLEPVPHSRGLDVSDAHLRRAGASGAEPEALPDLLLIERARGGDTRAIEALIRRYGRRLFRVARSVLHNEERAEAAVLEAYLAAFSDLNRYEPTGKFAAWLTRLTFNQARALRAGTRPGTEPAAPAAAVAADELQARRELEQAIGALPDAFRTVFVLRVIEGVSGIETAASLLLHETTVRTRLYRSQRRLTADTVRRVHATPGLLQPTPERTERIVRGVLAQLPHVWMLAISASSP